MDDYGIGASARAGLAVYEQAARRSGRTLRMVRALKAPFLLIVDSAQEVRRHKDLIAEMRPDLRETDFQIRSIGGSSRAGLTRHRVAELRSSAGPASKWPTVLDHLVVFRLYAEAIDEVSRDFAPNEFEQQTGAPPPVSPWRA